MKKNLLSVVFFAVFSTILLGQNTVSEENTPVPFYQHEYSFGCFSIIGGAFNNGYEYHLNPTKSIRVETEIIYSDNLENSSEYGFYDNNKTLGYMLQLQYKYYVLGDKTIDVLMFDAGGIYLGPFVQYRYHSIESYTNSASSGIPNYGTEIDRFKVGMGGVIFGGRLYFFKKIVIDASVGGGLRVADIDNQGNKQAYKSSPFDIGYSGIAPTGNFTIGIRF